MFFRYLADYFNDEKNKYEHGFFNAADYLKDNVDLEVSHRKELTELISWFDKNLPIPQYYQAEKNRTDSKAATSWYKDSATSFIKKMNILCEIYERYNIQVERVHSKELAGKKIYEDEYQVTIIPFRDLSHNVK